MFFGSSFLLPILSSFLKQDGCNPTCKLNYCSCIYYPLLSLSGTGLQNVVKKWSRRRRLHAFTIFKTLMELDGSPYRFLGGWSQEASGGDSLPWLRNILISIKLKPSMPEGLNSHILSLALLLCKLITLRPKHLMLNNHFGH